MCKDDINAIKSWKLNLTENDDNKLNSQGAEDLSSLGFRLKDAYKDIFDEPYSPTKFNVIYLLYLKCSLHRIYYYLLGVNY